MVKVVIDGKDLVGKDVVVFENRVDADNEQFVYSQTFRDYWTKVEPSQSLEETKKFLHVPKEIQFVWGEGKKLDLKIGKKYLTYSIMEETWEFICDFESVPTDCVLVPIKREELHPGDWAFWTYNENPCIDKEHELSAQYELILDKEKGVHVEGIKETGIHIIEEYGNNPDLNWFKVIPRSEVEKQ